MLIRFKQILLLIPPLLCVVMAGLSSLPETFDRFIYDALAKHYSPINFQDRSVVIIDIDRRSLEAFSGWPIDRSIHAQAIKQLTSAQVSSVTYNVAFIAYDGPQNSSDQALLSAIRQNGKVILPMLAEQNQEMLPFNGVKVSGAKVAHSELPLDSDEMLRRNYMHAGIGFPRWPNVPLATLSIYAPVKADDFSGLRSPYLNLGFSRRWSRDYEVLIPLGIDRFLQQTPRYSLIDLVNGQVDSNALKNKAVFVGIADAQLEPKKSLAQGMFSATEVHAFNFAVLNQGYALSPSLPIWAAALGVLVTLCIGLVSLVSMPIWLNLSFIVTGVVLMTVPLMMVSVGYWLSYLPMSAGLVVVLLLSGARFLLAKKNPE